MTTARFPFHITFTLTCAACGETWVQERPMHEGSEMPWPTIWRNNFSSEGNWQLVNGRIYCPKHRITVTVEVEAA